MRPTWLIESGVAADRAQRSWEAASTVPVIERGSFMHRKIPAITILICGLVLLSGCRTPTTLPPAAEPASTHPSAAMTDAAVLQVVFDDMLSKDNAESPLEWHGDPSAPVYVSKNPRRWPTNASEIFSHRDESKWRALTKAQQTAATEAADDLVARMVSSDQLPELRSTSGRLKIFEDAGPATQPTRENFFEGGRAAAVYVPGYSEDGRYAVVNLGFPWSGRMHSGQATYILEHTDRGWKVLLRNSSTMCELGCIELGGKTGRGGERRDRWPRCQRSAADLEACRPSASRTWKGGSASPSRTTTNSSCKPSTAESRSQIHLPYSTAVM